MSLSDCPNFDELSRDQLRRLCAELDAKEPNPQDAELNHLRNCAACRQRVTDTVAQELAMEQSYGQVMPQPDWMAELTRWVESDTAPTPTKETRTATPGPVVRHSRKLLFWSLATSVLILVGVATLYRDRPTNRFTTERSNTVTPTTPATPTRTTHLHATSSHAIAQVDSSDPEMDVFVVVPRITTSSTPSPAP